MRIQLPDQKTGDHGYISWHRSVEMPLLVQLSRRRTRPDLSLRAADAESLVREQRVGWAVLVRRWRGKTVYWTWRRGRWSADARRVGQRLRLIGFLDVPIPDYPLEAARLLRRGR